MTRYRQAARFTNVWRYAAGPESLFFNWNAENTRCSVEGASDVPCERRRFLMLSGSAGTPTTRGASKILTITRPIVTERIATRLSCEHFCPNGNNYAALEPYFDSRYHKSKSSSVQSSTVWKARYIVGTLACLRNSWHAAFLRSSIMWSPLTLHSCFSCHGHAREALMSQPCHYFAGMNAKIMSIVAIARTTQICHAEGLWPEGG